MNEELVFLADEEEDEAQRSAWNVLIVDDEPEVHAVTKLVLSSYAFDERGIVFYSAYSGAEAERFLRQRDDMALILLDVVMESEEAGLDVVRYIRRELKNELVRIILRTGQPGYAPESKVVMDYDINDYKEKTELTSQRLVTAVTTALRSYRDLTLIERNKRGVEQILKTSPEIFSCQSIYDFGREVLEQLKTFAYGQQETTGFVAVRQPADEYHIVAADGKYESRPGARLEDVITELTRERIATEMQRGELLYDEGWLLVRWQGGAEEKSGLMYLEGRGATLQAEIGLLELFRLNVAAAFKNMNLQSEMDCTLREIALREAAERELKQKNTELQQVLTNLQTVQMQMIQQEKMAGIGQLAAGVAHEINNPLGFIRSNFDVLADYARKMAGLLRQYQDARNALLKAAPSADSIAALWREIGETETKLQLEFMLADLPSLCRDSLDGLERVTKIIQALRAFSRSDEQQEQVNYNLNEGLETTLVMARNEIKYVAQVETDYGDVPLVRAQGGQINQVLLNLIVNAAQAIKAAELPNGIIRLRTFVDGAHVCCSVTDNGPPIPPDIQKRMMEPFFTTKPVGQGTGLGLSISYDIIVNKHGGKLEFSSDEERGTVFVLKLPAHVNG